MPGAEYAVPTVPCRGELRPECCTLADQPRDPGEAGVRTARGPLTLSSRCRHDSVAAPKSARQGARSEVLSVKMHHEQHRMADFWAQTEGAGCCCRDPVLCLVSARTARPGFQRMAPQQKRPHRNSTDGIGRPWSNRHGPGRREMSRTHPTQAILHATVIP